MRWSSAGRGAERRENGSLGDGLIKDRRIDTDDQGGKLFGIQGGHTVECARLAGPAAVNASVDRHRVFFRDALVRMEQTQANLGKQDGRQNGARNQPGKVC